MRVAAKQAHSYELAHAVTPQQKSQAMRAGRLQPGTRRPVLFGLFMARLP
jgi:hypothetical protein